jgi:hypothetical protein
MAATFWKKMRFRVRLHTPLRLPELVDTLTRAECSVRELGPAEIAVDVPRAPTAEQAERELEIYLALWRAQHPEGRAVLVVADS